MPNDFDYSSFGSIAILTPRSAAATEWCDQHLPKDAPRWGQCGYAIEARYFPPILEALQEEGFEL